MIRVDLHSVVDVELSSLKEFGDPKTRLFYNNEITIVCKDGTKFIVSLFYDEKPINFGEGILVKTKSDA